MSEAVPLPGAEGPAPGAPRPWRADAALVVAAFFFGTTFLVVQDALDEADPVPFLAVRFLIAGAVLGVLGRGRPATPRERRHGIVAGAPVLVGHGLQTIGPHLNPPAAPA